MNKTICIAAACAAIALMAACSPLQTTRKDEVSNAIDSDLQKAGRANPVPAAPPAAVSQALMPPLSVQMPQAAGAPVESRFDLSVNAAPAPEVFMALVSGTRYSMLVHPDIKPTETITINLKNVTLAETLEAIREIYGYEYKIEGTRIYVEPITLQTRIFQIDYLVGRRVGLADVRVTSGSITGSQSNSSGAGTAPLTGTAAATSTGGSGGGGTSVESSRVTTSSDNDLWGSVGDALRSIIGPGEGRNVVVNAQAGVIMVRALPSELRSVEQYLKAMSLVVERQVMLEAKIIEVALTDQYSTGINWAAFTTGANHRLAGGILTPGSTLSPNGTLQAFTARDANGALLQNSDILADPAQAVQAIASGSNVPGSIFGLAFQTGSFAALLDFLESQGTVHVLSSPRIATLNNQKAVIKVGTDEFFVTNVSTTTTATGTTTTVSPTITVQPFFSGIALDVMPQISDDGQVTLHIHPSVSAVTDKTKTLNLGTLGTITLPLASSDINESDTIVRVRDGTVAAIGGLMKQQQSNDSSGLPGLNRVPLVGNLFGSKSRSLTKSELVILIKPTIIKGDTSWQEQAQQVGDRVQILRRPAAGSDPAAGAQ